MRPVVEVLVLVPVFLARWWLVLPAFEHNLTTSHDIKVNLTLTYHHKRFRLEVLSVPNGQPICTQSGHLQQTNALWRSLVLASKLEKYQAPLYLVLLSEMVGEMKNCVKSFALGTFQWRWMLLPRNDRPRWQLSFDTAGKKTISDFHHHGIAVLILYVRAKLLRQCLKKGRHALCVLEVGVREG